MELNLVTGLGFFLAVLGLGLLGNSKRYAKMYAEVNKNVYPLYLAGFITLIMGLVITALNFPIDLKTWIVEIVGWVLILKGAFLFVFPSAMLRITRIKSKTSMMIFGGILCLVLGLILLFF